MTKTRRVILLLFVIFMGKLVESIAPPWAHIQFLTGYIVGATWVIGGLDDTDKIS